MSAIETRVERLLADYAGTIDDDQLEQWPEYFTHDCVYRILTRDGYRNRWPAGVVHCEGRDFCITGQLGLR